MWRHRAARWLAGVGPLDIALVVAVLLVGAVAIGLNAGKARGYTHLVLLSVTLVESSVALLFRRRHPIGALVGVLVVYTVFQLPPTMLLPVLAALFTVATHRPGRVLACAALGTAAVVIGRPYLEGDAVDLLGQQLPLLAAIGLAASSGTFLRVRRSRVDPGRIQPHRSTPR